MLPSKLADDVLTGLHSSPAGGHMGLRKTLEKVRSRFYWVGQRRDVETWCNSCDKCCSRKSPNKCPRAPLQIDLPQAPFERVAIDILGPLPETRKGNKYILVIGDYFTKWKEAFPMQDMEASTVATYSSTNLSADSESRNSCTPSKGKISNLPSSKSYVNFWA